ncbi:MAG: glycogen synthase GlgA [Oscillospiraceae bacterium]|nr:glycogen synthase GlgA [Oscillospiraceae bacterium]
MKILFAASEAVPFIKSGGLADVAGSLTVAVRNRGHACRVVLPLYEDIPHEMRQNMKFITYFNVTLGWRNQYCGVFETTVGKLKFYFLDNEYYFKRRGLYGFFDDGERFAFFSKAILEMLNHIDFSPEIIHCNDWQTALTPVYLDVFYRHIEKFKNIKTVFTIHNIQYQGTYDLRIATDVLGLPEWAVENIEFQKDANYLKGGIEACDTLTTVSPTYAQEILDPWFAYGIDPLLRKKQEKLCGILNGIDYVAYDPSKDEVIPYTYTANELKGKAKNKKELQRYLNLEEKKDAMLIGMVSRLVGHKGLDLVKQVFDEIMEMNVQFVLLGSGDLEYENFFREAQMRYPGRVCAHIGYDDTLARKIYASCDVFLMPSKSEPCGLSQMIALRYGTIPIVRCTGGLRDSVYDFGGETGNGYNFLTYNAYDMLDALHRAFRDFADKDIWKAHIKAAMGFDFSWGKSAIAYLNIYKKLLTPD